MLFLTAYPIKSFNLIPNETFFLAVTSTRLFDSSQCNELRSNKRDEKFNHLLKMYSNSVGTSDAHTAYHSADNQILMKFFPCRVFFVDSFFVVAHSTLDTSTRLYTMGLWSMVYVMCISRCFHFPTRFFLASLFSNATSKKSLCIYKIYMDTCEPNMMLGIEKKSPPIIKSTTHARYRFTILHIRRKENVKHEKKTTDECKGVSIIP